MNRIFFSQVSRLLLVTAATAALLFNAIAEAEEYEELRYEDLVQQLSQKRESPWRAPTADEVFIHAGFGFVSSSNSIRYQSEVRSRPLNGFQLSAGIDLLSDRWIGEFLFRNFANRHSGTEKQSLQETDWRVVYKNRQNDKLESRFGLGFGTRHYHMADSEAGYDLTEDTPVGLITFGVETFISKSVSLGVESGLRSALIAQTKDVNSIDLALRLESRF